MYVNTAYDVMHVLSHTLLHSSGWFVFFFSADNEAVVYRSRLVERVGAVGVAAVQGGREGAQHNVAKWRRTINHKQQPHARLLRENQSAAN